MLVHPPKTFLDTQIVIDAGRGAISADEWSAAAGYLKVATRYCISPLTAGELIFGLERSGEKHFENHRRELQILIAPNGDAEVFDFIPYFVGLQLGLDVARPAHLEDDMLGSIGLILDAPSKAALLSGYLHPNHPGKTVRVRVDRLVEEHSQSLQRYFDFMDRRRDVLAEKWKGPNPFRVDPEAWASFILNAYGSVGPIAAPSLVASRLSAAYEFEMSLNAIIRSRTFSLSKNRGDLVDGQQLFYLCDPLVVFITNDARIRRRAAASPQTARIKSFSDLLRCADTGSSLL